MNVGREEAKVRMSAKTPKRPMSMPISAFVQLERENDGKGGLLVRIWKTATCSLSGFWRPVGRTGRW